MLLEVINDVSKWGRWDSSSLQGNFKLINAEEGNGDTEFHYEAFVSVIITAEKIHYV